MSARVIYRPELDSSFPPSGSDFRVSEAKSNDYSDLILKVVLWILLSQEMKQPEVSINSDHPIQGKPPNNSSSDAAHSFETAFKRFEPMFHTVFYRKYHPDILADAKQVALLALYKQWCKDKTLLDQSASFVTTAAIWGISNWRKKEMKRLPHEKPLRVDNHGHVIGETKARNPRAWSDAIDFRLDVNRAVHLVLLTLSDHPDYRQLDSILHDIIHDVPFVESWKRLALSRSKFKKYRDMLKLELSRHLADYRQQ